MSSRHTTTHIYEDNQGRSRRRVDFLFIFLLLLAFLSALAALAVLTLTLVSDLLDMQIFDLVLSSDQLPPNNNIYSGGVGLLLIALLFAIAARFRLKRNRAYQFSNGCPSCQQHDLIRVRRSPTQRLSAKLFRIPLRNYACRNCQWRGVLLFFPQDIVLINHEDQSFLESTFAEPGEQQIFDESNPPARSMIIPKLDEVPYPPGFEIQKGSAAASENEESLPAGVQSRHEAVVTDNQERVNEPIAEKEPPEPFQIKTIAEEDTADLDQLLDDVKPQPGTESNSKLFDQMTVLVDPPLPVDQSGSNDQSLRRAVVIAPFGLSLRSAPDKNADIIYLLESDSIVEILDDGHENTPVSWRQVQFDGQVGWASAAFLRHLQG